MERVRAHWLDAVGFALGGLLLAAAIQWLVEAKHHADESAWDRVEAMWGYPFLGLVALTILFLLGHLLHARHDVFVAHRDRGDKAEDQRTIAEADRDKHAAERDERAAERDAALVRAKEAEGKTKPQIGQYVDKLIELKLPDDAAAAEAAVRQLGFQGTRFTAETSLPERFDTQPSEGGEPQVGDPQTDDQPDDVAEP